MKVSSSSITYASFVVLRLGEFILLISQRTTEHADLTATRTHSGFLVMMDDAMRTGPVGQQR